MTLLKSDRLFLRAIEPSDVDTLFIWENDVENWRVSETKAPFSRQLLAEFTTSTQDLFLHKQIRFMICLNADQKAIGTLDLFDYDPINRSAGIGILIQRDEDKGNGYASESLEIILEYSKSILNLKNLFANMHASNVASIGLFEKLNYQLIGRKKLNLFSKGKWEDELLFQLIIEG